MDLTNLNIERKNRRKQNMDISTMLYGKIPPQARELEEAILGAIMIDDSCLVDVVNLISSDVFYVDAHNNIFSAILSLYDKGSKVDILTVVDELKRLEKLDLVGGAYYVTKLTNNVVSNTNIDVHCKIVLECYLKRGMIQISGEAMSEAFEDSTDIFELYDQTDDKLIKIQEKALKGQLNDINSAVRGVYEEYESVEATGVLGIKTYIKKIDSIFCGLVAPDLFIIAARPGAGKTSLALSITYNTCIKNNIPCAWFSLEMDSKQLVRRLASIDSNIPHKVIREGKIDSDKKEYFFNALERIKRSPIYIEDSASVNIRSLRTKAHILKRKHKIKFIIVDYLQLMSSVDKKNQNREGEISAISRGLKTLAKELEIPIIALSQLSRAVESRADKMPQLSDLRESGAIEQDADIVLFLMRPEYYGFTEDVSIGNNNYNVKDLCIGKGAKNRHGAPESMAMRFNAPTMYFTDHENDLEFNNTSSGNWQPFNDTPHF